MNSSRGLVMCALQAAKSIDRRSTHHAQNWRCMQRLYVRTLGAVLRGADEQQHEGEQHQRLDKCESDK
jgi:hypothetical protein